MEPVKGPSEAFGRHSRRVRNRYDRLSTIYSQQLCQKYWLASHSDCSSERRPDRPDRLSNLSETKFHNWLFIGQCSHVDHAGDLVCVYQLERQPKPVSTKRLFRRRDWACPPARSTD